MKKSLCICIFACLFFNIVAFETCANETLVWPVIGNSWMRDDVGVHANNAIDINSSIGEGAIIVAAMSGKVIDIYTCTRNHYPNLEDCDGFGTGVVILGSDGRIYQYAHMMPYSIPSNIYSCAEVYAGQPIGKMGNTGSSGGVHLHFGISNDSNDTWGDGDPTKFNYSYLDEPLTNEEPTKTYTVTFDPSGGEVEPKTITVIHGQEYGTLPIPKREGYVFLGWGANKDSKTFYTEDSIVKVSGNHNLYAVWRHPLVFFDAMGGNVTPESKTVIYKSTYGDLPIPEREGYAFLGWGANPDSKTFYKSGTTVKMKSDHKLYAIWEKEIILTFDATGGNVNPGSKIVKHSSAYGELPIPTREGYIFLGWGANPDSKIYYNSSSIVTVKSNHKLYAVWKEKPYIAVLEENKKFTITLFNIETGNLVILALYNGGILVEVQTATYVGEELIFTTDKVYAEAKVMVWENSLNLKPVCDSEIVG